jgi:glutathione S-transferase
MTMDVYWISGSPYAWTVLLTLELKKLDYTSRLLVESQGELKTPEFLALNPRGQVPVMRDGDLVLPESLAILAYIERKAPDPPMLGRSAEETGRIWKFMLDCHNNLISPVDRLVGPALESQHYGGVEENADDMREAAKIVKRELGYLEAALTDRDWLVGSELTAADMVIFPFVLIFERAISHKSVAPLELDLGPISEKFPAIGAWKERITALDGFEKTYPPHWRAAA